MLAFFVLPYELIYIFECACTKNRSVYLLNMLFFGFSESSSVCIPTFRGIYGVKVFFENFQIAITQKRLVVPLRYVVFGISESFSTYMPIFGTIYGVKVFSEKFEIAMTQKRLVVPLRNYVFWNQGVNFCVYTNFQSNLWCQSFF